MLKEIVISCCLSATFSLCTVAQVKNLRIVTPQIYSVDSLKKLYGQNKIFIPEFETACFVALSCYPELKDVAISFKQKNIETTGKTTMTFFSAFKNRRRHYIVYLDNKSVNYNPLLRDIPFNAQVGIIAHELAHIVQFKKLTRSGMLHWGLEYFFKQKKELIEKEADLIAIQHGAGWQLYDWMDFVATSPSFPDKYKAFKRKYYLQAADIKQLLGYFND